MVLLTTNLLKKELRGATVGAGGGEGMYHAGLAINCLSNIVTEDLGRELLPDLLHLLNHPSPYIRKKALLCLYKVFLKYPQGLRLSFDKIKACLEDSHPSVVSCAVNVITELSDVNPKNYLPLAPAFFKLLTSSANNWMLIKVVKLLGSLVPEEPRLARKLLEPLSNIVKSTHAKSLLYEAVYAITVCLQYVKKSDGSQPSNIQQVVELCASTLRNFVQDSDQNLKYLGLVGFGSLVKSQPKVLMSHSEHRGLILRCLSDEDITIRTRALGLLKFMTTQRNLVELITQLLSHVEAASGQYRCDLVQTMIGMCSSNKYELVMDFAWYVDVLVILAGVRGIEGQGDGIARQWMDVAWRVLPVRAYAVKRSLEVLVCRGPGVSALDDEGGERGESERHILPEVLPAAAWIVGEYSHLIPEALSDEGDDDLDTQYDMSSKGPYHALVQAMTAPTDAAGINPLPCTTQAVFVQNAMKIFSAACQHNQQTQGNHGINLDGLECSDEELRACVDTLMKHLVVYMESPDAEVKERSFTAYQLLLSIGLPPTANALASAGTIASHCRSAASTLKYLLTPEPMKPISAKAQRRKLAEAPPSPLSVKDWEENVQWDVFWFLEEETPCFGKRGGVKGSIESVSFTKQHSGNNAVESKGSNRDGFSDMDGLGQGGSAGGSEATALGTPMGSQFSSMGSTHIPTTAHRRASDPFYLQSSTVPGGLLDAHGNGFGDGTSSFAKGAKDTMDATSARFGSIQLDSGGESDEDENDKKSKKKKKKKVKKALKSQTFSSMGSSSKQELIVSDDEEDDDNEIEVQSKRASKRGRAFENLALVDLTTPLGEDDVILQNQHYVVPDRPRMEPQPAKEEKAKKKKKDKEKKKKSSKKEKVAEATTGDLLGFDSMAFGSIGVARDDARAAEKTFEMAVPAIRSTTNPINSAFDDLLGLEMALVDKSNNVAHQEVVGNNDEKHKKADKKAAKKSKKEKKKPKKQ